MSSPPAPDEVARHLDADHAWRRDAAPQLDRLERSLALLPAKISSLLDVGVGEGDFLRLLSLRRPQCRLAALDLSPRRLADLSVRHADGSPIAKHEGDVTQMPLADGAVDVVCLLEVIEHVPEWPAAVEEALRVARQGVLVTTPYREELMSTVCVHCHRPTPLWGHLHSFDERSLDAFSGRARVRVSRIPRRVSRRHGILRWLYRCLLPETPWIAYWLEKRA